MVTVKKLPSGSWRAQVHRNGQYASKTFRRKGMEAEAWGIEAERAIQLGTSLSDPALDPKTTFGHLIDLHLGPVGNQDSLWTWFVIQAPKTGGCK